MLGENTVRLNNCVKSFIRIWFFLIFNLFCSFTFTIFAQNDGTPQFGNRIDLGVIENDELDEASGIVASRKTPGIFYAHNDSGDEARLFVLNRHGKHLGFLYINDGENRDWEDIAIGPGPVENESYIYIGDIGDNNGNYLQKFIYRVKEPVIDSMLAPFTQLLTDADKIVFKYPDGNRDAETLLVDPMNGDIYIISKRETQVHVYRLAYPQSTNQILTAEYLGKLNLTRVVAGDISLSGKEIILKTYPKILYWQRPSGYTLWETLQITPFPLPYVLEPQGEAVCWDVVSGGYYTTSEETFGVPAHLYYYPRLNVTTFTPDENKIISRFELKQNYPNPFNTDTQILFRLAQPNFVRLSIFNLLGKEVEVLVNKRLPAGEYIYHWNSENFPSGIYLYRLKAGREILTGKLIIQK